MIAAGKFRPVMDSEFALEDAVKAHARMESSGHVGKIGLKGEWGAVVGAVRSECAPYLTEGGVRGR